MIDMFKKLDMDNYNYKTLVKTGFLAYSIGLISYYLLRRKKSKYGLKLPKQMIKIIQKEQLKERVIIIGDIHGCYDEFLQLLNECQFNEMKDTLILVGDLVNKGPKSAEMIQYARQNNVFCTRGNHDDQLLYLSNKNLLKYDLTQQDLEYLRELPYIISLPSLNSVVVHAGLVPGKEFEQQNIDDMIFMRNLVQKNGTLKAIVDDKEGEPWAKLWNGPQHVYFGHDAKRGLQQYHFATGLDTGCCYGKSLTAVILLSEFEKKIVQIKANQVYNIPKFKIQQQKQ